MSKDFILRVQSPDQGTKRISTSKFTAVSDFLLNVREEFELPRSGWKIWTDKSRKIQLIQSSKFPTLKDYQLKHGDMLLMEITGKQLKEDSEMLNSNSYLSQISSITEDEVDLALWNTDGRIARPKNDQLCHHGAQGKCLHCVPYEPFDEEYLAKLNPPIKFLSFHSYLRKLSSGVDKGKFVMLEKTNCKIKSGCKEHLPWPAGICTKCQPNAVTLQRQKFRHVDYIQFENHFLADRFLDFWRKSGEQRFGFLYGRYEAHSSVPLGIKAVVSAIYEPKQINSKNMLALEENLEDDNEYIAIESIANQLNLRRVGWVFTDLMPLDRSSGTVKHFRGNVNSHFLSAEECIMAADLQNLHLNPCRLAKDGTFGSKFVTVVITGDSSNHIHLDGFQVSEQCMALVEDDCFVPTYDASELGYIKQSTNNQYVPDVFYKGKDGYGNEITHLAQPLPIEYLLIDIPVAIPVERAFTFTANEAIKPFPIEHRKAPIFEQQNFESLHSYIGQFSRREMMTAFKDLHLLFYFATCDMLPLKDELSNLLKALLLNDEDLLRDWMKEEAWSTVEQMIDANNVSPRVGANNTDFLQSSSSSSKWSCRLCTFYNDDSLNKCGMCNTSRSEE